MVFFVFSFFGSFVVLYISLFVFFFQFEGQEFERSFPWNVHFLFLIVTIFKSVSSLLQVDDDLPFESIYDALINRVPPPPNQATQPVRHMEFELTWIMYLLSFGCHPWKTFCLSLTGSQLAGKSFSKLGQNMPVECWSSDVGSLNLKKSLGK